MGFVVLNIFEICAKKVYRVVMESMNTVGKCESAKILIVDDEPLVTKTLKTLLNIEGYKNVECFNNPLDALEHLKLGTVELIISDFIMPELNGIEFLTEAKKFAPNCTQMLLTGYADKENAIKAINELGIFKYIEKPWNNAELLDNIKSAIERTQLKKELEQTIFDNCADGIIIFDNEFRVILANIACQNIFGVEGEKLIGNNFFELIINEKNQKLQRFQGGRLEKKPIYLRDFSLVNYKTETKIPIEINISPVFNEVHNFFVGVIRDVSYQKETDRLRDDFIATLTHDLRTPLLAAISGLEFVLDKSLGDLSEKQNLLLDTMKKSNEDMLGLVNALLEVYRYESGELFLCKTQFCLNNLIKKCATGLQPLAEGKKIIFDFGENDDFIINADMNEIRRIVMNLISNALKHSGDSTEITIKTSKGKNTAHIAEKDVVVSVKDNGVGLNEADCQKLFKRFSQGTSRKRTCSTGLGLYLSRQIVEAHGGKIWVETSVGKGCEFKFVLKNAVVEGKVLV